MFEILSDKFTSILESITGKGRLTEKDVDNALRDVRLALLEADVNFKVTKDFISRVKERSIASEVIKTINPGHQVVKIVHEELTRTLDGGDSELRICSDPPTIIMLVGLQGSGKTTTAAKLALHIRTMGQESLLIAGDLRRPAAIQQLESLGAQLNVTVYSESTASTPIKVATNGILEAKNRGIPWVIIDTSGRLHMDEDLMKEVEELKIATVPSEILLVVDSMMGQDAVQSSYAFNQRLGVTGAVLTKLDGDARGGSALSIKHSTGVPIKFIGIGEHANALEPFHPDRLASRILGMGDVLTLVDKAKQEINDDEARKLEKKMRQATFTLEDFLDQFHKVRRMGSFSQIMEMIPGFSKISKKLPAEALDEKRLDKIEAIINSMTPFERQNPDVIVGSRRKRIAQGSGTGPNDVNQLLNQFGQAKKLMKQMASGKLPRNLGMFK